MTRPDLDPERTRLACLRVEEQLSAAAELRRSAEVRESQADAIAQIWGIDIAARSAKLRRP